MKRRTFLRGLAGATLGLPFLGSIGHLMAQEQRVRRLVIFFQPNGVNMEEFFPTVVDGALTDASMQGRGVAPLAPFREKLLVPRGLHMSIPGFVGSVAGCDHRRGMACKLTAQPTVFDDRNFARGRSLDFEAASYVHAGGEDPLVLHVGRNPNPSFHNATDYCSYRGDNDPYSGENNPWNVYRTMMNIAPGTPTDDWVTRQQNSINDLVREDLDQLRRLPLSRDDDQRLSDWLDLVRDTEVQMGAMCSPDTPSELGIVGTVERYDGMENDEVGSDSEYRAVGELMIQLTALSMVCDHRRVATIQWSRGSGGPTFRWDGLNHDYTHHQISHRNGTDADPNAPELPGVDRIITEVDTWYAGRFARLLTLLDSFDEEGNTVLDNSAVMWINELSDGNAHHFANLPVVIGGSAGGYLRQGLAVDCSASGDLWSWDGAPHNRLLTTLLNAVGARNEDGSPIDSFGSLEFTGMRGEIDSLKA